MIIYLIGYMGSGKTSTSYGLAKALSIDSFDTDQLIEQSEELSIKEIFEVKGQTYFRLVESKILNQIIIQLDHAVVATGGGLPVHEENMNKLKESGITFYLKLSVEELAERLFSEKDKRPLLAEIETRSELESFISNQLKERELIYSQANYIINGGRDIESVIESIKSYLPEINQSA